MHQLVLKSDWPILEPQKLIFEVLLNMWRDIQENMGDIY